MLPLYLVKILSENKRLMVNYRCGGVVTNQLKKGLLLTLPAKNFLIGEYLAKLQARTWLSRALSSSFSSVLARRILDAAYICTNRPTHNDVFTLRDAGQPWRRVFNTITMAQNWTIAQLPTLCQKRHNISWGSIATK